MKLKKSILLLVLLIDTFFVFAQDIPQLIKKDSTTVSSWMFGIGYSIIDDSGDVFDRVLDIRDSWHALPYPTRISVGKYFKNGLGIEAIAAYTKYNDGKRVDRIDLNNKVDFFSIDARLSYDLNKLVGDTRWFDPYIGLGVGYTDANNLSRATFNGVLGFRTWFNDNWGLDINSSGKWSFDATATNYIQHVVGVVYKFDSKKELTKKGEEKLALINEFEKENIRIKDSIALDEKAKEITRLQEAKLAQEKENVRLAQIEKEKQEARNKEKEKIQNAINALDKIYFPFNSSKLNKSSQDILAKLVTILNNYPDLIVEIGSHTDARGSASYNMILSEKRLKSTLDYLRSEQIKANKVVGKAYGETKLTNECNNNTPCSETKHKANRRSEIKVISN